MKISLPKLPITNAAGQKVTSKALIVELVLALAFWKQNDLKIVDSGLEIYEALEAINEENPVCELSASARDHLLASIATIPYGMVQDREITRLMLRIQRALHIATDAKE